MCIRVHVLRGASQNFPPENVGGGSSIKRAVNVD